jgi:hypothetical protein
MNRIADAQINSLGGARINTVREPLINTLGEVQVKIGIIRRSSAQHWHH